MPTTGATTSPVPMARIAGALWLFSVIAGIYAEVFVRGSIIDYGNAAATAAAIAASEPAYRLGFVADLLADMAYLGATIIFYVLLKPVGRTTALVMVSFGLAGSAAMAANLVNLLAPLLLLNGSTSPGGNATTVMPFVLGYLRFHAAGYNISIAFFSIQVAAAGYLTLRSAFVPRIFGVLFLVEAACNLVNSIGRFLDWHWVKQIGNYILLPGLPAEGGIALWLLLVGVNAQRWVQIKDAADQRQI